MKRITSILVCLAFIGLSAMAQDIQITGKVTNADDGSGLPGVSVVVKGTTAGIATDIDGNYSLKAPSDAVLVFTSIGMETQEVAVAGRSVIDVAMTAELIGVEEVVVTAYGISRDKKAIAYQTESVAGDELMKAQSVNATTGMVGKVAGLQINVQDNGVKPNTQILLRGMRSVAGNNEALVVIDGAIASTGALEDLNPNDIESINVLKGATAAALYGSSAMNGALIITTKSGSVDDRFHVGVIHTTTVEQVSFMPDFQTKFGTGWDGEYNNIENTNWGPRFDGQMRQIGPTMPDGYILETQMVPYAPVQNNLYDFFNKGMTYQNTVYLTGGDKSGGFYLSAGNQRTTGIVPDDTYKRNTVRVNANKKIGTVELGVSANYFADDRSVTGDQIGDQERNLYWFLLNTPANIPLSEYSDWDNPESYGYADNYFNAFYQNPYWAVGTNRENDQTNRLVGNVFASWDIIDNINFTTRIGANSYSGVGKNWRAEQNYNEELQPYHTNVFSFVEDTEFKRNTYTWDAVLSGKFNLTQDIKLKAIAGSAIFATKYSESFMRANNLSIEGFYDISNGTGEVETRADAEEERNIGFFGDIELSFRDFIYLNATGRQDYTSTLAAGENGYFYPAFGMSFILTEAVPMLKNNILSYAKITANNSTVYNDLNPYQINERYSQFIYDDNNPFSFPYGDVNGFYRARTAVDADIQKEKLNSTEFGLNLAFFNGRATFDATYFLTKTTNLITATTPSSSSGADFYLTNIGELKGSGYELSLGGTPVKVGDFSWNINLNLYSFETVVVSIKEDIEEIFVESYLAGYGTYAVVGEAFPMLKAVAYVRDDEGRVVVDPVNGNPLVGEVENMGKTTPDYILSGNTSLNFKGISLSATADYRANYVYYSQGSDQMEFTGRSMECVASDRQDFVWPNSVYQIGEDGEGNPIYTENVNLPITGGRMEFWQNDYNTIKENYVKDATAFKLRELSLTYTLPGKLTDKIGFLNKLTVGLVGRNLVTWLPFTEYRFSDPEFRNTRDTDADNGIGIGGYFASPPTRNYGFTVNVEF